MEPRYWKKNVTITGLILILIILGLVLTFRKTKPDLNPEPATEKIQTGKPTIISNNSTDSDQDSLMDWEETLWKTSPQNPDTDGDGTPDGEEVKLGRDPVVANTAKPGEEVSDKLNSEIVVVNQASSSGLKFEPAPNLINNLITVPELSDGATQESPEQQILRSYGNSLGQVVRGQADFSEQETEIFNNLIAASTTAPLDEFLTIAGEYQKTASNIGKLNPPTVIKNLVSELQTNYQNRVKVLKEMASFTQLGGITQDVWQNYTRSVLDTAKNLLAIMDFFKAEGITFEPDEPGYIFNI